MKQKIIDKWWFIILWIIFFFPVGFVLLGRKLVIGEKENNIKLQKKHNNYSYSNQSINQKQSRAKKTKPNYQKIINNIVCIDTETTGLHSNDEILQLSIVDGDGNTLFNKLICPVKRKTWKQAEEIHGITYAMVKDEKHLLEYRTEIESLLKNASLVIGYNLEYDLKMLEQCGISTMGIIKKFDVMKEFAPIYGKWNEAHQDYKWQKLVTCAKHYGYKFNAHNSLEDAKATVYCYKKIIGIV